MTFYLLKNRTEDAELGRPDPYEEQLGDVRFVPIMDCHSINVDETARFIVANAQEIDGLIVTSPRAVDVLRSFLVTSHLLEKPIYTVGPATAARLRHMGFKHVYGELSGSGAMLAEAMKSSVSEPRRFLFLAGEVHRVHLPNELARIGHTVSTKIVYRTSPSANVVRDLRGKLQPDDWLIFFSPSHVDDIVRYLQTGGVKCKIAAIGPTTESFLRASGIQVDAVAEQPTAHALKLVCDRS